MTQIIIFVNRENLNDVYNFYEISNSQNGVFFYINGIVHNQSFFCWIHKRRFYTGLNCPWIQLLGRCYFVSGVYISNFLFYFGVVFFWWVYVSLNSKRNWLLMVKHRFGGIATCTDIFFSLIQHVIFCFWNTQSLTLKVDIHSHECLSTNYLSIFCQIRILSKFVYLCKFDM